MFTNLTSYFWGGGSAAGPTEAVSGTQAQGQSKGQVVDDLVVVPKPGEEVEAVGSSSVDANEEEDWLMVDSHLPAGSEDDEIMEDAEGLGDLQCRRPVASGPANGPGMEESWIIAPTPTTLPCLVESAMEVSPLETLLIEHPSMSVYHKLPSPVRSLPPVPQQPASSKPEAPTIEVPHQPTLSTQGSQTKKLVVRKPSSNQKSKQPAKPPQIPFILLQKAQKHKPVPESPSTTSAVAVKPKSSAPQQKKPASKLADLVVPNKMAKVKSKKVTPPVAKKTLAEIQNAVPISTPAEEKPITKVSKKPKPAPMNRIVESNIKEMFPTHVYPKDMRPFVEDFQNNANTRQHRELIAAQRRSQLTLTRAKRTARRNPSNGQDITDDGKTDAATMMEQKENNLVEMRRQEQFETLLRSSQKQQQKRLDQSLRKNHLTRSNKTIHEASARNKRQRRNDHANKPSYANNNRKSQ